MNYVAKGVMIGGFALVAAPAEYGETGVDTFIVSQDGVVYEKDFGPASLSDFMKVKRFNPEDVDFSKFKTYKWVELKGADQANATKANRRRHRCRTGKKGFAENGFR